MSTGTVLKLQVLCTVLVITEFEFRHFELLMNFTCNFLPIKMHAPC
jgi:hypothetical protein